MYKYWLLFFFSIGAIFSLTLPSFAGAECGWNHRVEIGDEAIVKPEQASYLHTDSHASAEIITTIPGLEIVAVLQGPECHEEEDGYVWWRVDYQGLQGWTIEFVQGYEDTHEDNFYLMPLDSYGRPAYPLGSNNDETVISATAIELDAEGRFSFNGLSFSPPQWLHQDQPIIYTYMGPVNQNNTGYSYSQTRPAYLEIFPMSNEMALTIRIYPAPVYEQYQPNTIGRFAASIASRDVSQRPEVLPTSDLPILATTRRAYIDLAWGTIYQELSDFAQDDGSLVGHAMIYLAAGLSHDGRFLLQMSAELRVEIPIDIIDYDAPLELGFMSYGNEIAHANHMAHLERENLRLASYLDTAPENIFSPSPEDYLSVLESFEFSADALPETFEVPQGYLLIASPSYLEELISSPSSPRPVMHCSGTQTSFLNQGDFAIQVQESEPVSVRLAPAGDFADFEIPPGEIVQIIDGPLCLQIDQQMFTWWEIQRYNEITGWVTDSVGQNVLFREWSPNP